MAKQAVLGQRTQSSRLPHMSVCIVPISTKDGQYGKVAGKLIDVRRDFAPVAQLTLNQRVHGSSPCAPTIESMT
jgi:hypothetical protein